MILVRVSPSVIDGSLTPLIGYFMTRSHYTWNVTPGRSAHYITQDTTHSHYQPGEGEGVAKQNILKGCNGQ